MMSYDVICITQIEGTFQLSKPLVLLGYHLPPPLSSTSSSSPVDSHNVYIQLFISIEPTLSALPPISEKVSVCIIIKYFG